ncbi:MAG: trypsin-like peptidase domain-containing protein [Pseudomonadales bacterium]|jgi:hypothetical protein
MLSKLYGSISETCCVITVVLDDEVISMGTGFCFLESGEIITAGHVVTGRFPIRAEDADDPAVTYFAKFPGKPLVEYKVVISCITITVEGFSDDIQLDLAILIPTSESSGIPFLNAHTSGPVLGEEVFLAGYSDELDVPFGIQDKLQGAINGASDFFKAMDMGYQADMTGPMIKRGVVGNIRRIIASGSRAIECDVFYVDNGMHSGASAAPS